MATPRRRVRRRDGDSVSDGQTGYADCRLTCPPAFRGEDTMIDQTRVPAEPAALPRDERSMRVMEYAMAIVALVAAVLLSLR